MRKEREHENARSEERNKEANKKTVIYRSKKKGRDEDTRKRYVQGKEKSMQYETLTGGDDEGLVADTGL